MPAPALALMPTSVPRPPSGPAFSPPSIPLSRRVDPVRCGVEALAVTAAVAGLGRVIMGPLRGFPAEDTLNAWLQERRTPLLDRVTWALSAYSDTIPTIVTATTLAGWRWRRGGRRRGDVRCGDHSCRDLRRDALRPLAAIALETAVFMTAAALVGRGRPDVVRMDRPAPTSSFPSGHTGASTALHLTIAEFVAERATGSGRALARGIRLVLPPLVGWSRLYRGMHHPTDVVVGLGVGVWSHRMVRRVLAPPTAL